MAVITYNPWHCHLHSANTNVCIVPRTSAQLGDRSFCVTGPRVWNSLPSTLRQPGIEYGQLEYGIPPGSLNRVPASAGVKAGKSPLPGGR